MAELRLTNKTKMSTGRKMYGSNSIIGAFTFICEGDLQHTPPVMQVFFSLALNTPNKNHNYESKI